MSTINVYLVRHGQTYFNYLKRFQGWSDMPLTPSGIEDGHAAGQRLANVHFDAVFSSDLKRAVETARYILSENQANSSHHITKLFNLREQFFGSFEGLVGEDVAKALAPNSIHDDSEFNAYGQLIGELGMKKVMDLLHEKDPEHLAEDGNTFYTRLNAGLDEIKKSFINSPKNVNILVVAHGTLIRALAEQFGKKDWADQTVENGAVMTFSITNDQIITDKFNDTTTIF